MARKYICDNCGKKFDSEWHWSSPTNGYEVSNLYVLVFYPLTTFLHPNSFKFGEYCADCKVKIEARIKEGVN
jgi:hypothetical protein